MSPAELPKDAHIIVTNLYADEILAQLQPQGFTHVESYAVWEHDLLMTPIKKELCEVLQ